MENSMKYRTVSEKPHRTESKERNYKADNIRFILIFLVVFGHFLELFSGTYRGGLYKIIYTFHMPCFLFLTGYYAKFDPSKLLRHLVVPYLVFQTLYLLFNHYVLADPEQVLVIQFTTPYWLLWYLLSVIFYYLLLPVITTGHKKTAIAVIAVSILLSILAGFDKTLGYYMSLSRTIVFFPFFVTGYYLSNVFNRQKIQDCEKKHRVVLTILSAAVLTVCGCFVIKLNVPPAALYGSYSYAAANSTAAVRILIGSCAVGWILFLFLVVPNRRFPFLTTIGQNTLAIYLPHGFLQRAISKHGIFHYSQFKNLLLAAVISCAILAFFGNKYVGRLFKKIF
ncbi:MAG: acyltransferase family protein [Oscillospiraceae bacterium]|nr:acyltransferase family protein [Oscillospiraceae bacterium]